MVLIPFAAQTTLSGSRWSVSNLGEISCRNSSRRLERTWNGKKFTERTFTDVRETLFYVLSK